MLINESATEKTDGKRKLLFNDMAPISQMRKKRDKDKIFHFHLLSCSFIVLLILIPEKESILLNKSNEG